MSLSATPLSRCIGCDVGKSSIVVFDEAHGRTRTIANQPQDIANAVRFLCSPYASYISGEKINVHGGGQRIPGF